MISRQITSFSILIEFDTTVEPLRASLNEPLNNGTHSGVGMIRGWALSEEGIEKVEVFHRW